MFFLFCKDTKDGRFGKKKFRPDFLSPIRLACDDGHRLTFWGKFFWKYWIFFVPLLCHNVIGTGDKLLILMA